MIDANSTRHLMLPRSVLSTQKLLVKRYISLYVEDDSFGLPTASELAMFSTQQLSEQPNRLSCLLTTLKWTKQST